METSEKTLPEYLLDDARRELVVKDCVGLIDGEVQKKKGVSGFAIRGAYKVVKRLDGGRMIPKATNDLLPDFAKALEPFHKAFRDGGRQGSFRSFAAGREGEFAEALLAVTDGKAEHAKNAVMRKLYFKLRPRAKRDLEGSIPGVTEVMDKHARDA